MKEDTIEITVDKDNKVSFHDFIEMKIKYEEKYKEKNKEIERLNKIIGHALGYIECANKVDITYVCKILQGSGKE